MPHSRLSTEKLPNKPHGAAHDPRRVRRAVQQRTSTTRRRETEYRAQQVYHQYARYSKPGENRTNATGQKDPFQASNSIEGRCSSDCTVVSTRSMTRRRLQETLDLSLEQSPKGFDDQHLRLQEASRQCYSVERWLMDEGDRFLVGPSTEFPGNDAKQPGQTLRHASSLGEPICETESADDCSMNFLVRDWCLFPGSEDMSLLGLDE